MLSKQLIIPVKLSGNINCSFNLIITREGGVFYFDIDTSMSSYIYLNVATSDTTHTTTNIDFTLYTNVNNTYKNSFHLDTVENVNISTNTSSYGYYPFNPKGQTFAQLSSNYEDAEIYINVVAECDNAYKIEAGIPILISEQFNCTNTLNIESKPIKVYKNGQFVDGTVKVHKNGAFIEGTIPTSLT